MRWLKRDMRKAGIAIAGMLLLLVLMVWVPVSVAGAHEMTSGLTAPITVTVQASPTANPTIAAQTAQEQLTKLQRDNDRSFQAWFWSSGATFLSTLVLVGGGLLGFWRWRVDRRDAQARELKDRRDAQDKELEDRKVERERRSEERFQAVVEGLGSTSIATQVGAAIMLRTFLSSGYEQFYSQTFDLAVAYLRLRNIGPVPESPDSLNQALIRVFRESFPLARDLPNQSSQSLDALGIRLDGAYLARSDLRGARIPESYLRKANLVAANLREANLRDAILIGANLNGADLGGANFDGADLREANLSRTNLEHSSSLKKAKLFGVKGLWKEQLEACKAKGAIIDEDSTVSSPPSPVSPPSPSQSTDVQTPSATPAQGNLPTPDTGISSATSSQQGPEP